MAWYRTRFRLAIPFGVDASLGLMITDDPSKAYRALIFVNGWNLGQYINGVGPQTTFVLPAGILDPRGDNTLAIAVTSGGLPAGGVNTSSTVSGGLGAVALVNLGTVAGGAAHLYRTSGGDTSRTCYHRTFGCPSMVIQRSG